MLPMMIDGLMKNERWDEHIHTPRTPRHTIIIETNSNQFINWLTEWAERGPCGVLYSMLVTFGYAFFSFGVVARRCRTFSSFFVYWFNLLVFVLDTGHEQWAARCLLTTKRRMKRLLFLFCSPIGLFVLMSLSAAAADGMNQIELNFIVKLSHDARISNRIAFILNTSQVCVCSGGCCWTMYHIWLISRVRPNWLGMMADVDGQTSHHFGN